MDCPAFNVPAKTQGVKVKPASYSRELFYKYFWKLLLQPVNQDTLWAQQKEKGLKVWVTQKNLMIIQRASAPTLS